MWIESLDCEKVDDARSTWIVIAGTHFSFTDIRYPGSEKNCKVTQMVQSFLMEVLE